MVINNAPRNRGCNTGVRFDLGEFTDRLFTTLGSKVRFVGPGPCLASWHSCTTSTSERFAIDYLANEMFTKFDDGVPTPLKRTRAVQRFLEGELMCALTNCKFSPLPSGQLPSWLETEEMLAEGFSIEDSAVFHRARKIIHRVLGAYPGDSVVLQYADFGPGATTRLPRRRSHRSNKWAGRPHVTPFAASSLLSLLDELPLLRSRLPRPGHEIVAGNKLDWVPKNYKIDRTIAIEPDLNMFFQKGLGGLIRKRLKRVKQDLSDQSINRFLAALGSITGELTTLDLSMASDTVAYRLAEFLFSPEWFDALVRGRSPIGFYIDDAGIENAVVFEKLSSMGNGATFEVETMIFYGILRAVSELSGEEDHRLYVYGDDIVIPTGLAGLAMTYLNKAGFIVNPEKSFWTTPFRESCGGHYFAGDDVTPFYVREPVDTIDRLFLLHNNVLRWFNRWPGICDPALVRDLLLWIRSFAPEKWQRPRLLSEDVGDGAFIGSFDEVCPTPAGKFRRMKGWEGWRVETLQYSERCDRLGQKPGKSSKKAPDSTEKGNPVFERGSGPDLASLWATEWREPCSPPIVRGSPRFWLDSLASVDAIEGSVGISSSTDDVPYAERWWHIGHQVLPWVPGYCWWYC